MKVVILFGTFLLSIFLIKSFYEPTTPAQLRQASVEKLKRAELGLVSKTRITKNIEKTADVWEEIHRVHNGVVIFKTVVFEYQPGKFTTSIDVKHQDLKGKMLYSRHAYSQSKSIDIHRYGKDGVRNASTGVFIVIDFKKMPSDQCLRNRFKLIDMPKACDATIRVQTDLNIPRLRLSSQVAVFYDVKGKAYKRLKATEVNYVKLVKKRLAAIYKEAKVVDTLKEPRI